MTPATPATPIDRSTRVAPRARRLLALFLLLHGLAHLAGTSDAFSRASGGKSVDYLAGGWSVSDPTSLRLLGVLWMLVAVAFVAAAVVTWAGGTAWPRVLWWVASASLAIVVVALWSSVIGVVIDVVLLAVALRAGALTGKATE